MDRILMAFDEYNQHIGYYYQGKIYDDLADIKLKRKEVLADMVYIVGQGIVDMAQLREQREDRLRKQTLVDARLNLDPLTKSLRGLKF